MTVETLFSLAWDRFGIRPTIESIVGKMMSLDSKKQLRSYFLINKPWESPSLARQRLCYPF